MLNVTSPWLSLSAYIAHICLYMRIYTPQISAPTDEAFAKLPEGTIDTLLENVETLEEILFYHVIEGKVLSSMVSSGPVTTLLGDPVEAVVSDSGISFNGANVIGADVEASNGVIHAIDEVLLPPDVQL